MEQVDSMTASELAAHALIEPERVDPDDSSCRLYYCARCRMQFHVSYEHDPARFCDACAHEMVDLLARALVLLTESTRPDLQGCVDREYRRALDATKGNKSEAARLLGVSRWTVHRWMLKAGKTHATT